MTELTASPLVDSESQRHRSFLFAACFVALVATSFAFIIRVMMMDDWQIAFGLSETQKGEIFGAGLWPFGISIVLFSLIIDRIGYGKAMIFAFACHVASVVLLITAKGYWSLYVGSLLNGLAAGTVEAVINPVVASMYAKSKTKMLTVLHAGWPGGFVLGGLTLLLMKPIDWRIKVVVILIPVVLYGLMLLRCRFPVNERVLAGVSYKDMLKEAGVLSALIVSFMVMKEIGRVLDLSPWLVYGITLGVPLLVGLYARSLGRPMYIFLLLVMIMLAITELSTDTWIKDLMGPAMNKLGLDGGWVLVYTATIMMVLRFCIGPIVKVLKPLGVLLCGSLFAAAGLLALSQANGVWILLAATVYGTGQTFFWPVTLGLISERFPKGGALTLNAIAGVGMLGAGILGNPLLGILQDRQVESDLRQQGGAYVAFIDEEVKTSIYGKYLSLDTVKMTLMNNQLDLYSRSREVLGDDQDAPDPSDPKLFADEQYRKLIGRAHAQVVAHGDGGSVDNAEMVRQLQQQGVFVDDTEFTTLAEQKGVIDAITTAAKRNTLAIIAILPLIMAGCYLGLILYFRAKGGYKAIELTTEGQASEHAVTPAEVVADAEETPSE